jgi:hypothetical protein
VKLTAAVGALRTLGTSGLTGAAQVTFADDDGSYSGTVKGLYTQAIEASSNESYNRLMEIAGFDEMNDVYLVPSESMPLMVLQRRYTKPLPTSNLRSSPPISYSEGTLTGQIAARVGVGQHPECPDEGNCTTLLELLDVLRRVTLHSELPQSDRFPLAAVDVANLQSSLLASPTELEPGASQALGHTAQIYNKDGQVWTDDHLDHGLIVDPVTTNRFLLAISIPYSSSSASQISELARHTLLALLAQPTTGVTLQRTAGVTITVQMDDQGPVGAARRYHVTIDAPTADSLEVWVDGWPLGGFSGPTPYFSLTYDFSKSGDRLMIVRASAKGKMIGYRALAVHVS